MRCKACNKELGPYEIIWRPYLHKFEDLCRKCRDSISDALYPRHHLKEKEVPCISIQSNVSYIQDQFLEEDIEDTSE
jgi:hypothetical protein